MDNLLMIKNNKKAAMFGLDARIALAIFASLSLIASVALYNVVENAKATAIIAEFNEVGKAWEQYFLDTGKHLKSGSLDPASEYFHVLKTASLVSNTEGLSGWRGPYIDYEVAGDYLDHPEYNNIHVLFLSDDNPWGGAIPWQDGGKCTVDKDCHVSILINGFEDEDLAYLIDKKVDGGDGSAAGAFRWWDGGVSGYRYHFKFMPVPNPN